MSVKYSSVVLLYVRARETGVALELGINSPLSRSREGLDLKCCADEVQWDFTTALCRVEVERGSGWRSHTSGQVSPMGLTRRLQTLEPRDGPGSPCHYERHLKNLPVGLGKSCPSFLHFVLERRARAPLSQYVYGMPIIPCSHPGRHPDEIHCLPKCRGVTP